MALTLYHNPKCSTSRKALALLEANGYQPEIVEYLKTGWSEATLKDLLKQMGGIPARDILRTRNTDAVERGLTTADDSTVIAAMIAEPVLVERPILVTPRGAVVARPLSRMNDILDRPIEID
ncbi:arsenate reductase (glutaredoxin) [Asticcacaulis tiandongensis]|uniref:arsenate reductase (glutaredoxin) n=1 Tax=Asticcacaulis tiandongensis TaxID=2565365 RepID=UPI00112AB802|nr:arsenate reductase (glutaredoxin) [Asticcacaulis tiandongensis]